MTASDPFVTYDAAYVLGALSPEDRQEFEEHLTLKRCPYQPGNVLAANRQ